MEFVECLHFPVLRSLKVFYFQNPPVPRWSLNPQPFRVFFRAEKLKDQAMFKLPIWALALAGASLVSTACADTFADAVIDYTPGAGFAAGFTNPAVVLGEPSTVNPYGENVDVFDPPYGTDQIVSIGTGGSLTVRFKQPILNHPRNPFGIDFMIYGNSGFIITNDFDFETFTWIGTPATDGSLFAQNDGETRVSVSQDGKKFFVLDPTITSTVDSLYPTDGSGDFHTPVDPTLTQDDFSGLTQDGLQALYNGSAGGTGYDISWARDDKGKLVWLPAIRYVRIEVLSGKSEVDGFSAVFVPHGQNR